MVEFWRSLSEADKKELGIYVLALTLTALVTVIMKVF